MMIKAILFSKRMLYGTVKFVVGIYVCLVFTYSKVIMCADKTI